MHPKTRVFLAATIIGAFEKSIGEKVAAYKKNLDAEVLKKVEKMKTDGWENGFDS